MSSQEAYMMYAAELDKLASLVDLADEEIQEKFAYDALGGYVAARSFDETMAKLAAMNKLKGAWNSAKGLFSRNKVEKGDAPSGAVDADYKIVDDAAAPKRNPYLTAAALGGAAGVGALGSYAAFGRGRNKEAAATARKAWEGIKGQVNRGREAVSGLKDSPHAQTLREQFQIARENPYLTAAALGGAAGVGALGSYAAFGRGRNKEAAAHVRKAGKEVFDEPGKYYPPGPSQYPLGPADPVPSKRLRNIAIGAGGAAALGGGAYGAHRLRQRRRNASAPQSQ